MLSKIFKNKLLISLLFGISFTVLVVPINEAFWFDLTSLTKEAALYSNFLKLIFAICLFSVSFSLLSFAEKIYIGENFYKKWLQYSLIYGSVLLIVLMLIFPGYWSWDEFFILESSRVYEPYSWHHIFTQMQYIFSIYVFPTSTTITLIQLSIITAITGYVIARVNSFLPPRKINLLLFLPFLTFPILISNFYTLRLHLYGYLLLLLSVLILHIHINNHKIKTPTRLAFLISTLIAITAFWRTEGIYLLVLLPVVWLKLGLFNAIRKGKRKQKIQSYLALLCSVLVIISAGLISRIANNSIYTLSASIGPLSLMAQNKDSLTKDSSEWSSINKVVDLGILKKYPSFSEIPAYWEGPSRLVRKDYENHLSEYYQAYGALVIKNPKSFLFARSKTFLASNSLYPTDNYGSTMGSGWLTPYSINRCTDMPQRNCEIVSKFDRYNRINLPFSPGLREKVIKLLIFEYNSIEKSRNIRSLFWNALPIIIGLLIALAVSIYRRQYEWALAFSLPIIHAILTFITAPAVLFMYYFPVYLGGGVLLMAYVLRLLSNKSIRKGYRLTWIRGVK